MKLEKFYFIFYLFTNKQNVRINNESKKIIQIRLERVLHRLFDISKININKLVALVNKKN